MGGLITIDVEEVARNSFLRCAQFSTNFPSCLEPLATDPWPMLYESVWLAIDSGNRAPSYGGCGL